MKISNVLIIFLVVGLLFGGGIQLSNKIQSNINAQIKAQVNLKVQEVIKQFKIEYKANRTLYKAIYTSSFEQQEFYFQTNKNPFEVAKNYLPDKWTGLKIEEVAKIEK
jgi:hypothetical protein